MAVVTLLDWFQQPCVEPLPVTLDIAPFVVGGGLTQLHVLAALVSMNRGLHVHGWGVTDTGGPYGRQGLLMDEALSLMHAAAFIGGWVNCLKQEGRPEEADAQLQALYAAIHEEVDRVCVLRRLPVAPRPEAAPTGTLLVDGHPVATISDIKM